MSRYRGIEHAERTMFSSQSRGARLALASSHREEAVVKTREYLRRLGRATALESLPCVHIAGTKGKGSTCAFVECMLRKSGLKTGLFVSPHLTSVRERFRINGVPVCTEVFLRCFWRVWDTLRAWKHFEPTEEEMAAAAKSNSSMVDAEKPGDATNDKPLPVARLVQPLVPGFFHLATLVAFEIFIEEGVDVAVVEVGLGGRLDATNVIPVPAVTGIATLDYDHVDVLGGTIQSIAREKAGIMKPGCPSVSVRQPIEGADATLVDCASRAGVNLSWAEEAALARLGVVARVPSAVAGGGGEASGTVLGLAGRFQMANAALASSCAEALWKRLGQWGRVAKGERCDVVEARRIWRETVARSLAARQTSKRDADCGASGPMGAKRSTDGKVACAPPKYLEGLPPAAREGLRTARWDGRCQTLSVRLERAVGEGELGALRLVGLDLDHPEAESEIDRRSSAASGMTGAAGGSLGSARVFLDGAHTERSMLECVRWFQAATAGAEGPGIRASGEIAASGGGGGRMTSHVGSVGGKGGRVLVFNASHEKDVVQLLLPLTCIRWDAVFMCPFDMARPSRKAYPTARGCLRKYRERLEVAGEEEAVSRIDADWGDLTPEEGAEGGESGGSGGRLEWQNTLAVLWRMLGSEARFARARATAAASVGLSGELPGEVPQVRVTGSVRETLELVVGGQAAVGGGRNLPARDVGLVQGPQLLCTGSLYLVGNVLGALERK